MYLVTIEFNLEYKCSTVIFMFCLFQMKLNQLIELFNEAMFGAIWSGFSFKKTEDAL